MTNQPIEKQSTKNITINSEEYKKEILSLLSDYVDVKKEAAIIGYDADVFKFKDYIEHFIRLNNRR